jgi:hypothetical protein
MEGTIKTLTEQQIQSNMRAVAHAIAQQELEGLTVPKETVADLERVARGEIDTDEARRNIQRRSANEEKLRR